MTAEQLQQARMAATKSKPPKKPPKKKNVGKNKNTN